MLLFGDNVDLTSQHHLVHQLVDGVHAIAFQRDAQGQTNQEFAKRFFATDFLRTCADMHRLVIDLSGVISLDSSALGPLVQKLRDIQERSGKMALAGVDSPALREIFALTRFDKVFAIYPARAEAINAVAQAAKSG